MMIALAEPMAALPAVLAGFRSQILAPAFFADDGPATEAVGTGPCRIMAMVPLPSLDALPLLTIGTRPQRSRTSDLPA